MSEKLLATATTKNQTNLSIGAVSGDVISVDFDTMPGNMPATYGNFLAIWQNQGQIPWNQEPLKTQNIERNSQAGSSIFENLDVTTNSYIIGYSVGTDIHNICSTAVIPAGSSDGSVFATSVSLAQLGSTSVMVGFSTPAGYLPKTNKNWIGIWRGSTVPYNGDPIARADIGIDGNEGTTGINNVDLHRSTTYTIGYFMGAKQTNLAASVTFTV